MALIKCPECSNGVSTKAAACPQCGCPIATDPTFSLPDSVKCLGCEKAFPFEDHLCPNCGLFNSQKYNLLESMKPDEPEVVEKDDVIRCPKCGARNTYHAAKQGFGVGKFVAGAFLVGPLTGLLAGRVNTDKVALTCLKCSHKWKP